MSEVIFGEPNEEAISIAETIIHMVGKDGPHEAMVEAVAVRLQRFRDAGLITVKAELADVRRWHADCGSIREGWDNMSEFLEQTGQQAEFEDWARKTGRITDAKAS